MFVWIISNDAKLIRNEYCVKNKHNLKLRRPLYQQALACFFAGISGTLALGRFGKAFLLPWIPYPVTLGLVGLYLAAMWGTAVVLLFKKEPRPNTVIVTGFWQDATRYFLGLNLLMAGLQKFVRLQFDVPLRVFDHPFNSLHGDLLVASFFSRSLTFFYIIGVLEILGALMLVFRKTQLLGVILLLPILLNITLINYFYHVEVAMQVHITLLTVVTVYLLLLEYRRLVNFFFVAPSGLPQFNFKSRIWKNVARFSIVYIPVILLVICKRYPRNYPELFGKYEVNNYSWGSVSHINRSSTCESVLTKVFIDSYALVLEYNDVRRRLAGNYEYDREKHIIKAFYHISKGKKPDTLVATVSEGTAPGLKILTGHIGKDEFKINMQKVKY
jgi:hypothetical protein